MAWWMVRKKLSGQVVDAGMGGMSRTGRGRGRARAQIAVVRVLDKRLGARPVVAQFGRRLRIAEIVDELCPVREVAWISHGEVIEALVANRLTAPAPLVRVEEWAAARAGEEAYGIEPHLLNDDRIARALDAVAPQLDAITGSVGAAAISEFGVDVARLHWDMTSISLYGAYPETDEDSPAPRWGHPKDRRPDLKQIQTGLAGSGDGGIPVFHRGYDGGAGEVAQVTGAMTALKQIAGPRTFLLVGDSKLISYANAAAMNAQHVGFVAPLAASRAPAGLFAGVPAGAGTTVDYVAARDAGKPAAARGAYRVAEDDGMDLHGPRKTDPVVHLRRILVYSSANAAGQAPGAKAGQASRGPGQAGAHRRDPVPPGRRGRGRSRPGDRRQTPRREVPAHRHHRRPGRQTRPGLALRPGRDRRRRRRGRLGRAADQPGPRSGR